MQAGTVAPATVARYSCIDNIILGTSADDEKAVARFCSLRVSRRGERNVSAIVGNDERQRRSMRKAARSQWRPIYVVLNVSSSPLVLPFEMIDDDEKPTAIRRATVKQRARHPSRTKLLEFCCQLYDGSFHLRFWWGQDKQQ
jgi:hypothetical protein